MACIGMRASAFRETETGQGAETCHKPNKPFIKTGGCPSRMRRVGSSRFGKVGTGGARINPLRLCIVHKHFFDSCAYVFPCFRLLAWVLRVMSFYVECFLSVCMDTLRVTLHKTSFMRSTHRKAKSMELIKIAHEFVGTDGVKRNAFNFFVVFNGNRVAVKPAFKEGYHTLCILAESVESLPEKGAGGK